METGRERRGEGGRGVKDKYRYTNKKDYILNQIYADIYQTTTPRQSTMICTASKPQDTSYLANLL